MALTDTDLMPFGKYRKKEMQDVPASYLLWFWDENREKYQAEGGSVLNAGPHRVMEYIEENMDVLQKEVNK